MPEKTPHTKAQKQAAVHEVMHEYKHHTLHSGSAHGPKVGSRAQAVAIAMSESGQSKPKGKSMSEGKKSMPAGQDPDPKHHSVGYSHLRSGHNFKGSESPSVPYSGKSLEASKSTSTTGSTKHTTMRGQDGFHDGSAAEAFGNHIGDGKNDIADGAHTGLEDHKHGNPTKARHHPAMTGEPHKFDRPPTQATSGFGHAAHQRSGPLRLSGHSNAHRIGKRSSD